MELSYYWAKPTVVSIVLAVDYCIMHQACVMWNVTIMSPANKRLLLYISTVQSRWFGLWWSGHPANPDSPPVVAI